MKKLLFISAILFSFLAKGQIYYNQGIWQDFTGKIKAHRMIAPTDTLASADTLSFAIKNGVIYQKLPPWTAITAGTAILTDSVYQRNDSVFYTRIGIEHFTGIVLQPIQFTNPLPGDGLIIGPDGNTIINTRPDPTTCNSSSSISLSYLSGLTYGYNSGPYSINCIQYNLATSGTVTAAVGTAPPGEFRTDLVYLDAGGVHIRQGDNSIDGVGLSPDWDPATEIPLGYIRIDADAVIPTGPASTIVYNNNDTTEFSHTVTGGMTAVFNYTTNSYTLDSSFRITLAPNGSAIMFRSRNGKLFQHNYTKFSFWIRNNAVFNNARNWVLRLYDGAAQVAGSNAITLTANLGYDKTAAHLNQWQLISFDIGAPNGFGGQDQFDGIQLRNTGTNGTVNVQGDNMRLETGVVTTPPAPIGNYLPLTFTNDHTVTGNNHTLNINAPTSFKSKDSIGTVFSGTWTSAGLAAWTTHFSTGTITASGNISKIRGTLGKNNNNYLSLDGVTLGYENYKVTFYFIDTVANNTSFGLGFGIPKATSGGTGVFMHPLTADSTGYIAYTYEDSYPDNPYSTGKFTSKFKHTSTDTIKVILERARDYAFFSVENMNTGNTAKLSVPSISPQVGVPILKFYSPVNMVKDVIIEVKEIKNPDVLSLTNSIGYYEAFDWSKRYTNIAASELGAYANNMVGPGEFTADAITRLPNILATNPKVLVYQYLENNVQASTDTATIRSQIKSVIDPVIAAGIKVVLVDVIPQDGINYANTETMINHLGSEYGGNVVVAKANITLKDASSLNMDAIYYKDGIHPNKYGSIALAAPVVSAVKKVWTKPVSNDPLRVQARRTSDETLMDAKIDASGNIVAHKPNGDSVFIKNQIFDPNNLQSANFSINGYGRMRYLQVFAEGNYLNPAFQVSPGGTASGAAVHFNNFYTDPLGSHFDMSAFNDKVVQLEGGVPFWVASHPFIITIKSPVTAGNGVIIDDDAFDGNPAATYRILSLKRNGIKKVDWDSSGIQYSLGHQTYSTGSYNVLVHNTTTHKFEEVSPGAIGGGSVLYSQLDSATNVTYNVQTGTSYTLLLSDKGKTITLSNASAITLTVPASLPAGFWCNIVQLGAGQVTITPSSTTVNNRQGFTKTKGQYSMVTLQMYTSNTFVSQGDME